MLKYCAKKIAQLLIVLVLISFFSFGIIYFAPGDVSSMYITQDMTDEQKEQVRKDLGLDRSMMEQYTEWAKRAVQGDFGVSLANKNSVAPQIMNRLPATIQLMGAALLLSLILAIPLGLVAGAKKNTWIDNFISSISYVGMSVPSFWLGMLLIIFFTAKLHILPSSGMHSAGMTSLGDTVKHMIMPCITLSLGNLAVFIRYVRANTVGQLSEEYVVTARAKGTPDMKILFNHVMKYIVADYYFIGNEYGIFSMWIIYYRNHIWLAWNRNLGNECNWFQRLSDDYGICHDVRLHSCNRKFCGRCSLCCSRSENQTGDR